MRTLGKVTVLLSIVLAALTMPSCKPKPSTPATRPAAGVPAAPQSPNAVMAAFVQALRDEKPEQLAALCAGVGREFWETIAMNLQTTDDIVAVMKAGYPNEETRRLDTMRSEAHKPMTCYHDLKLDGVLRGTPAEGKVVYQIAYVHYSGRDMFEEVTVEKVGDRWQVTNYGIATPSRDLLAAYRSQATKFRVQVNEFKRQFAKLKPRTLDLAFVMLQQAAPATELQGNQPGPAGDAPKERR